MISRILDEDRELGRVQILHYDPATDCSTIEERWDVEPIIESAQASANAYSDYRPYAKGDWHRVADLPLALWLDLQKQGITRDAKAFMRWLREHSRFKVAPGSPL